MITVFAHAGGLLGRADLPIPEWLFGWAAAVVLIVSFVALAVLWPEPRLEGDRWRPLPGSVGKAIASRPVDGSTDPTPNVLNPIVSFPEADSSTPRLNVSLLRTVTRVTSRTT